MEYLVKIIEEKCKTCYACVRACPVNAIHVSSNQAVPRIMPNRCIGCGSCIAACTPMAIEVLNSCEETKIILSSGKAVAAIVDPTIAAEFPDITDYRKFVQMIRGIGFTYVNEVAFGADLVAREYAKLLKDFKGKYYIMANDPVVIGYIEKFQPELLPNLAPIVTPAIATAKVVRKLYGKDLRVVYIGPVIASKKKEEKGSGDGKIDSVLTFSELRQLFKDFHIDEKQLEFSEFDSPAGAEGGLFPIAAGILQAGGISEDLLKGNVTTVEGELEMKEALREFQHSIETINSHFNIFYNEYLMGPGTTKGGEKYIRQASVKIFTKKRLKSLNRNEWEKNIDDFSTLDFHRKFKNNDQRIPDPDEKTLRSILAKLNKEVNGDAGCGMCGYSSCREFAIAIAKGFVVPEICSDYSNRNRLDYIKSLKISNEKLAQAEKALRESEVIALKEKGSARESNEIISTMLQKLPSGIVILDERLKVIQANQSFIDIIGEDAREIATVIPGLTGADLKTLMPYNIYNLFTYVLSNNENIQNRDLNFNEQLLNLSVFVIKKAKIVGGVFRDMYSPEVRKEEVMKRVNEVIDKNLSMVQQIGFLLGEGASETEKMLHSIIEFYKDQSRTRKD